MAMDSASIGWLTWTMSSLLLLDANRRVGSNVTDAVGGREAQRQNYNRRLLHDSTLAHHLCLVNTFFSFGPIFYVSFGNASRVDYIVLPLSKLPAVEACKILHPAGNRLQYISAAGRRDHRPLLVRFQHALGYSRFDTQHRWDHRALVAGVL